MASPFNIKRTTQVGRNGFDLSQRHLFNGIPGVLSPVLCEPTNPGDSFKINLNSFTRMRNIKTAAFARFKEYYDFYWCSMDTLWPYFNSMLVNNDEPVPLPLRHGDTGYDVPSTQVPKTLPWVSYKELGTSLAEWASPINGRDVKDSMGLNLWYGFLFLSDLLGYGTPADSYSSAYRDLAVNVLPFCLYQRIYQDFYRNPQWERRNPLAYNLRGYYGDVPPLGMKIDLGYVVGENASWADMFTLRYANWHKDYFMGLYPNQQFGEVSVVNSNFALGAVASSSSSETRYVVGVGSSGTLAASPSGNTGYSRSLESSFSIVDLRRAQALQRWKEVTMTNGSSMYQQVKAHFGFELPEGRKDAPEFIGGFDNIVSISDVDATAAGSVGDATSYLGQVGGKGLGVSDSRKEIDYTAKDFGYLMCIYHCEPLLDYNAVGVRRMNTKLEAGDFYLPEFDKIGFGTVESYELLMPTDDGGSTVLPDFLGYTSRYLDLKTSYDRVHGSFCAGNFFDNVNDTAWTVGLTREYLESRVKNGVDYRFFKVNPFIANNIMVVPITATNFVKASPMMVSADFRVYKSSNMSVDSLPN